MCKIPPGCRRLQAVGQGPHPGLGPNAVYGAEVAGELVGAGIEIPVAKARPVCPDHCLRVRRVPSPGPAREGRYDGRLPQ